MVPETGQKICKENQSWSGILVILCITNMYVAIINQNTKKMFVKSIIGSMVQSKRLLFGSWSWNSRKKEMWFRILVANDEHSLPGQKALRQNRFDCPGTVRDSSPSDLTSYFGAEEMKASALDRMLWKSKLFWWYFFLLD